MSDEPSSDRPVVRAVVLAAGASRRFGSDKLLAELDGKSLLLHVLDRLAGAGLGDPVVVLDPGRAAAADDLLVGRQAIVAVNPRPEEGLASSLNIGWAAALAADPRPDAVLVVLGDQPRISTDVIRRLVSAPVERGRPLLAPRYRDGGGPNPLRIVASAGDLVAAATGDRGLGPLIAASPGLVRWLDVGGSNPDVDLPADLARLAGH